MAKVDLRTIRNSSQRLLCRALRRSHFSFETEAKVYELLDCPGPDLTRLSVDVALEGKKVVVEVQGWNHAYQEKELNDIIKAGVFKEFRWTVIWWRPCNSKQANARAVEEILRLIRRKRQPRALETVLSLNYVGIGEDTKY